MSSSSLRIVSCSASVIRSTATKRSRTRWISSSSCLSAFVPSNREITTTASPKSHLLKSFSHVSSSSLPLSKHVTYTKRFQSTTNNNNNDKETTTTTTGTSDFFANPDTHPTFQSIGISSPTLLHRLSSPPLSLQRPSAVQAASYLAIADGGDVTIGAETGSGKTLAYLLPILEDVIQRKKKAKEEGQDKYYLGYDYARAIILVPNKELANQVVRMASSLCGGLQKCLLSNDRFAPASSSSMVLDQYYEEEDGEEENVVKLAILPGGLKSPRDFRPFRSSVGLGGTDDPPDIVVTTPASLGPLALSPKNIDLFADVQTLVIDEADMLLDGGYIRQLENVLMGFRRADKLIPASGGSFEEKEEEGGLFDTKKTQHVFVAATLPDMGLKSVDSFLKKKFPYATRITMAGMHNARHYGLRDRTVWIEDDVERSVANKERMGKLVRLLNTERSEECGDEGLGLKGEKVMVFLNSVEDVDGATNAFRRGGINAVPYHAKIPLNERASNLDRFRRYKAPTSSNDDSNDTSKEEEEEEEDTVPVLVCTDLASRGLDVPGVTAVVQLQFAGNVVSHLHRMGRCGRAGNRDGRGVIFYGSNERELVEVVREAEAQQERMTLEGDVDDDDEDGGGGEDGKKKKGVGSVKKAFSRKRGFTKKRKKERREAAGGGDGY